MSSSAIYQNRFTVPISILKHSYSQKLFSVSTFEGENSFLNVQRFSSDWKLQNFLQLCLKEERRVVSSLVKMFLKWTEQTSLTMLMEPTSRIGFCCLSEDPCRNNATSEKIWSDYRGFGQKFFFSRSMNSIMRKHLVFTFQWTLNWVKRTFRFCLQSHRRANLTKMCRLDKSDFKLFPV